MKKIISLAFSLSFILSWPLIVKAQTKDAILRGRTGPGTPQIVVTIWEQYGISIISDTVVPAPDRTFIYHMKKTAPGMVYLNYGDNKSIQLWLCPGDTLSIDLQGGNPLFEGTAAVFAGYYVDDLELWNKVYGDYTNRYPKFDDDQNRFNDRYFTIQDSITLQRIGFLEKYFAGIRDRKSRQFIDQQRQELIYSNLYYKLAFEGSDPQRFKFYQEKYKVNRGDSYLFSDKPVFNKPELLAIPSYARFMNFLVMNMAQERVRNNGQKWSIGAYTDSSMRIIDELSAGSPVGIGLKALFLNNLVEEIGRDRKRSYIVRVDATIRSLDKRPNLLLEKVQEKLDKIALDTRLIRGEQAPDFAFIDTEGKIYTLKDFKGKKVCMDLGASWCGPCIAGIPAWNRWVAEKVPDGNIICISLSLDDNEEKWKNFLHKREIRGRLLFAGKGGFKSRFAADYSVTSLPRFLLLDEEGKILEYPAPAPGSEAMETLLQKK